MRNFVEKYRSDGFKLEAPNTLKDVRQIVEYVKARHEEYVRLHQGVRDDCRFSLETCICVALSLLAMNRDSVELVTA
jgi:hypothetical protein